MYKKVMELFERRHKADCNFMNPPYGAGHDSLLHGNVNEDGRVTGISSSRYNVKVSGLLPICCCIKR